MRTVRALPWASLALLHLLVSVGPVRAQSGAGVDTLDRAVFGFLRPTYNSTYSVNRQQSSWDQDFSFSNRFSGISVDNKTSYTVRTDPKRPNFKALNGSTASQLALTVLNLIPVTGSVSYARTRMNDRDLQTASDVFDSGLNGSYNMRLFQGARSSVDSRVGLRRNTDTNTYKGLETGTSETALTRDLSINTNYNGPVSGMIFRLTNQFYAERTTPETINSAVDTTADNSPRTNTRTAHKLNWSFSRWEPLAARVDLSRTRAQNGYIIVSRDKTLDGRAEEASDENSSMTVNLEWKPRASTSEAGLDFRSSTVLNRRAVDVQRASDRSSTTLEGRVRYSILGTGFFVHMENTSDDDRSPVRGASTTLTRIIEGNMERPLTPAVTARMVGEVRLRSVEYDDAIQDNDDLKTRMEGSVTWQPMSRLSATLTGNKTLDNMVSVSRSQSRNTRLEENYGLIADYKYTLSRRTRITQKYAFQEIFNSFIFNAPNDNLTRTRNINTGISTEIFRDVTVDVRHNYEFRESGGYRRDPGGTRYFSKGEERYVQDLTASLSYRPTSWLSFSTNERIYRTDTRRLLESTPSVSSRREFTQTASLTRSLPGGGTLKCDSSVNIQRVVRPIAGKAERSFAASVAVNKAF